MHETCMLIVKKKRRISIPKNLNIVHSWNIIRPHIVAQEIGAPDYTLIPHWFDMNAYKIGYIFVPIDTQVTDYNVIIILDTYFELSPSFLMKQVTCFRSVPVLKILGPIHDFAVKSETSSEWLDKEFHSVRTSGDQMDFRVNIGKAVN